MVKKFFVCYVFLFVSFLSLAKVVTAESDDNKYESENEICEKCNCTDINKENETKEIFTIDCSMKTLENTFSEWPKDLDDSYKEIIYIMSFNTINKLSQFPSTDATIFFTCKNCKLSEIAVNAFIDVKNIVSIDLSFNEITGDSLHPDIFRGPHSDTDNSPINLQMLDLSHNDISYLDEKLFEHTPNLKKIVLSHNQLKNIADGTLQALSSCQYLEILHLEHTGISDLPSELFQNMKHLSEIILNDNQFLEVPASLSIIGSSLEDLQFNKNPIEVINSQSFNGLEKLQKLSINFMDNLKSIEKKSFHNLNMLEVLHCSENKKLTDMDLEDLLNLINLKDLDLSNNQLKTLSFGELIEIEKTENSTEVREYFKKLHNLKLSGNPWHCDCSMIKALEFFNHNSTYFNKAKKSDDSDARCKSPTEMSSKLLYILPFDFVCASDYKSKPLKIPVYDPPQFLRPKSIMLTVVSIVIVLVLGVIIGILIVCVSRRLKSNNDITSNPIRYSAVRNSTISNAVNVPYQQP
ncbi:unnamed protein product [Chironomus riparius]|uniref:Uncharacterized protein n=1 Tax=Chironomus riparius TaxID=315576 RepID=A0A9P0J6K3_9DIPT|nr:unnamed protein product [Chironomus riparius]